MIIEAKRLSEGVEGALEQAKKYVNALCVPSDVVVNDGICYCLYDPKNDCEPIAYANLARLKKSAINLFDRLKRQ